MSKLYDGMVQEYLHYQSEKRKLIRERDMINARLDEVEGILIDLNDLLCKSGNHIYEHFEEGDN